MPISHDGNIDLVFFGSQAISDVYHGTDLVYTKFRDRLYTVPGIYTMAIPRGYYEVVVRGGGGAGGGSSYGAGGAGGKGHIYSSFFVLTNAVNARVQVGEGGLISGGNGGQPGYGTSGRGGAGGGGGHASYLMLDSETTQVPYYGWKTPPITTGIYQSPTTTYYLTYHNSNPALVYISPTVLESYFGSFVLINGQTYTNNQQLYYVSDSATVEAHISINNGTVTLEATGTNDFNTTYVPLDVSSQFVGGIVYTQTDTPTVGDTVYDSNFQAAGVITSVSGATFDFGQNSYSRYSTIDTTIQEITNTDMYCAQGGGGGGGAGSLRKSYARYGQGCGGAGGGGYYYTDSNGIEINYAGKNGGNGGVHNGAYAQAGTAGNAMFPNCYSVGGTGGTQGGAGAAGATGGGASGGGGGFCGNESHDWATTGAGGPAAGGDYDAGGGGAGRDTAAAYNHHTTPTSTTAENLEYGVTGNYGTGGTPDTNGNSGFVYLKRLGRIIDPEIIDLGMVATAVPATPWVLGSITDAVSDITDCGNIM